MSRIASFVRAARAMLWMQVAAAVIATALGVWAVVAVRDLAAERDQLAMQLSELQRTRADAGPQATADGVAPSPLDSEVRPPAIMPVFIPIVSEPAVTPPIPPVDIPPPDRATDQPAPPRPPPPTDCNGPNADPRRCRPNVGPGRWNRGDRPVVVTPAPVTDQPPRGTDAARPNQR